MKEDQIVDIAKLESEVEARLLGAILEERGVAHMILSYHDTAYDGMYQVQKGWGVVRGEAEDAEEVRTILNDLRSADASVDMPDSGDDLP